MMVYLILFVSALGAATLLPIYSEAVLLYDLSAGYAPFWLWLVATVGNTLGSLINYLIGLKGESYLETKGYLPAEKMAKGRRLFEKYGSYVLLLSWMPVIGDPITFVAGVLRYDLKRFFIIVFIAKGVRYALLIWLSQYYFGDVDFVKAIVGIFVRM
jgi:membrane protein YqaA with SNARE-associated domain